ncbi:beta-lactam sensor histidine kinase BlrB [Aeromonas cavernicola]|uniref:histidine kinase n=1 Tax=Aeromonas cavernicola TaxID=1006623 RepID=A0A2H9U3Z4_9GAMM|nr:beta-lactam sensor histidine kinase BlrB [Aeromonas cavernicola]PJG58731.1 two-component system sensor histidine kinase CreC [Aeromonas cavernicola]
MRLGLQLLGGLLLIFALATWFVVKIFVEEIKPGVRSATEDTLVDMTQLLAPLARDDLREGKMQNGRLASAFARLNQNPVNALIDGHLKQLAEYRIYVTNQQGIVIYDSDGGAVGQDYSRWNDVYRTLRGQYGARSTRTDPNDPASSTMYVAAPLRDGVAIIGVLTVAKPSRTLMPTIERGERELMRVGSQMLLGTLLIGGLLVWWLNRAIGKLVHYADSVSKGEAAPLPRLHTVELDRLGRALETMRHQLDGKGYIEDYVHSLTHELKSPLAAIRGAGEILAEAPPPAVANRFIGNINLETARIQQLIERMLQLARLESGQPLDRHTVDPSKLATRVLDTRQIAASPRQISLLTTLASSTKAKWDSLLIEQAIGNLLDNAIDFSPTGATVRLQGALQQGGYCFSVSDNGPGIPDYALPRIFERFYSLPRPDKGKSSGLGLSFAHEVARQHGGRLTLCNRPEGGVLAELWLPLA